MYNVYFRSQALKIFERLERKLKRKIIEALRKIGAGSWKELDSEKLKGTKNGWRLRVSRWRILYLVVTKKRTIEVVDIFLKKSDSDYARRSRLF